VNVTINGQALPSGELNVGASSKRRRIVERKLVQQSGQCVICSFPIIRNGFGGVDADLEHVWKSLQDCKTRPDTFTVEGPVSDWRESNVWLAHGTCNVDHKLAEHASFTNVVRNIALALLT
jgi:5-methylcytosine-specific restriction endonuclease McrA